MLTCREMLPFDRFFCFSIFRIVIDVNFVFLFAAVQHFIWARDYGVGCQPAGRSARAFSISGIRLSRMLSGVNGPTCL